MNTTWPKVRKIELSDQEAALIRRYAWRIAKKLTEPQRRLLDAVLCGQREFEGVTSVFNVFKARLLPLAMQCQKHVVLARENPTPDVFPPSAGLSRFSP